MGTVYNFQEEMPTAANPLQATDALMVYEASSGLVKQMPGAQVVAGNAGIVSSTSTGLTITQTLHAGKVVLIAASAPAAITLPAATATGNKYTLVFTVAATATASTISRATSTDIFQGVALILATASVMSGFQTTATDNTMTFNGTSKGGIAGDMVEFWDIKSGVWEVKYRSGAAVAPVTPFSHT